MTRRWHRTLLRQQIEFVLLMVEPRSGVSVAAAYPLASWSVKRDWLLVASILAALWISVFRFWWGTIRYWLWDWGQAKLGLIGEMVRRQFRPMEVYGYG